MTSRAPLAAVGDRLAPTASRVDDAIAAAALRARRVPWLNRAMYRLSWLGDDGRVWIAAAGVEALRHRRPVWRFAHAMVWLGAESAVVNLGVKRLTRRERPTYVTEHEHALRIPTDTSFPSGHAASAATMAVVLSQGSPLWPLWTALGVGIGLSRVHVGVHHATDVAAGWLVGLAFGMAARTTAPPHTEWSTT